MYKVGAVIFALVLALGGAVASQAAPAAAAQPRMSKPVTTALVESQKLVAAKDLPGALVQAKAALAAAATPHEMFRSQEMLAYLHVQMADHASAADSFEALLASGMLPPEQVQQRTKNVCQLRYQTKQWDKAIKACADYASKYNDRETRYLVCQIYYQLKDYPNTVKSIRESLAGDAEPPENILKMLAQASLKLQDTDGIQWAFEKMVTHYPQNDYWTDLLEMVQRKVRNDTKYDLDVLRLRAAVGVIEMPNELIDLAQAAIQIGLPGEAKSTLERALAAGQIGSGADRAHHNQALTTARQQAAEDLRNLAKDEVEARKAAKGEADLRIGEALVSHGRVEPGIAAMQRGIGKGGLKDAVEAKLRLGLAQLQAGKREEALATLDSATGNSSYAVIARLWAIHLRNT